jgi:hypothetical protein
VVAVSLGIYAIERAGYAEILCDHCRSRTQLKEHIRNLRQKGYKVMANG